MGNQQTYEYTFGYDDADSGFSEQSSPFELNRSNLFNELNPMKRNLPAPCLMIFCLFLGFCAFPACSLPTQSTQNAPPGPRVDTMVQRSRAALILAMKNGLASGLASSCSKTVLHPFDVVKTLQQSSVATLTMYQAAMQLLARGGPATLYAGLLVSIVGSVPSVAVYFAAYQFFKAHLLLLFADAKKQPLSSGGAPAYMVDGRTAAAIAISAALANCVAACLRAPCELLKQRLQACPHLPLLVRAYRI